MSKGCNLFVFAAGVLLTGAAYGQPMQSCIFVQVEGSHSLSFDCLNTALNAGAHGAGIAGASPSVLPPTQAGTFSYTATANRLGRNFGHSVLPQRPKPPSFSNVLVSGAK